MSFRSLVAASACLFAFSAAPVTAQTGTIQIGGPSCPPPGGQVNGLPRPTIDKDKDGKRDRLYSLVRDKKGNDFQVWCLDHGNTGDYALYASRPGKTDVKIASCLLVCGNNKWTVEMENGVFKRFRGYNYDRRRPPRGSTTDYEFYYDFTTGKARRVTTKSGKPVSSERASLERADLPDYVLATYLGSPDLGIDTRAFDAWVREYDFQVLETPAGPGVADFVDVETFEVLTGQHLTTLSVGGLDADLLHYWQDLFVTEIDFDPDGPTLTVGVTEVGPGGMLTLIVPRELLDAEADGFDAAFEIAVNGDPVREEAEDASSTDRVVDIPVPTGATVITVTGSVSGREIVFRGIDAVVDQLPPGGARFPMQRKSPAPGRHDHHPPMRR